MYVCLCKGLTESDVVQLAPAEVPTGPALIAALGLDDDVCCGRCALEIDEFAELAASARCQGPCGR
jgi:bacterioferritin-associated ferredoxin